MKRNYYETPKPTKLMRIFWKAAGADQYILERSTYSDQIKYVCMGGIVIATGALAALAGGYAFYTIFEPKGSALDSIVLAENIKDKLNYIHLPTVLLATVFGLVWGLIIFNLDRFIVTSTGKGDGTEAITASEFKSALPRIIMGMIIALTISKPVEIRMFKTEIDVKLHEEQLQQQADYKTKVEKNYKPFADAAQQEISKREIEIQEKTKLRDLEQDKLNTEIQGKVGSGKEGDGPAAKSIRTSLDRIQNELNDLKATNLLIINDKKKERDEWQLKIKTELAKTEQVAAGLDGLLERIRICHRPDVAGGLVSLFITLLFMAIELTPIFFKLMLIKGPYDFIEENIKETMKAEHAIEIQYDYYKDKEGQQKDLVINHQAKKVLDEQAKLIASQKELNDYAIEKWKQEQKKKIDNDISSYIKES